MMVMKISETKPADSVRQAGRRGGGHTMHTISQRVEPLPRVTEAGVGVGVGVGVDLS